MSNSNNNGGVQIGFLGILQIVFIVLKLLNKIQWSWVWVLAPSWIGVILFVIALVILLVLNK